MSGLAVAVAMSAVTAHADDCVPLGTESSGRFSRCIDVDNLWFRPGDSKFLSIGPARTTPAGEVSFGAAASYSSRPLVLGSGGPDPDGRDTFVVDNLFDTTFHFALGATDRLELTAAAPVTFYQDGDGYGSLLGLDHLAERARTGFAAHGARMRKALEAVRGPEATQVVAKGLAGAREVKIAALNLLAGCGDASARALVKPHLDDSDNGVRIAAINALRGIVDGDPPLEQLPVFKAIELAKEWKARV